MIQTYLFDGEAPIKFDDSKTVRELIEYAFKEFGYYEPAGMDIITVFQYRHSNGDYGWFTTNTTNICANEIKNREELCFGYYKPTSFYFAEGGWGHHMTQLGNHPSLNSPILLHLRFADFRNAVVVNGTYRFMDVISYLKRFEYIPQTLEAIEVSEVGNRSNIYKVKLDDPIMNIELVQFEKMINKYTKHLVDNDDYYYIEITLS